MKGDNSLTYAREDVMGRVVRISVDQEEHVRLSTEHQGEEIGCVGMDGETFEAFVQFWRNYIAPKENNND